jgi:hypothetical protein
MSGPFFETADVFDLGLHRLLQKDHDAICHYLNKNAPADQRNFFGAGLLHDINQVLTQAKNSMLTVELVAQAIQSVGKADVANDLRQRRGLVAKQPVTPQPATSQSATTTQSTTPLRSAVPVVGGDNRATVVGNEQIRFVFFSASPSHDAGGGALDDLKCRETYDTLRTAILDGNSALANKLSFEFHEHGTLEKLSEVLKQEGDTPVLLHLLCHGHPSEPALLFASPADDNRPCHEIKRDVLLKRLKKVAGKMACVFLCSCHSGHFDSNAHHLSCLLTTGFAETTAVLVHPFVVAFYRALLHGSTPTEAHEIAREAAEEYADNKNNQQFWQAAEKVALLGAKIDRSIFDQHGATSSAIEIGTNAFAQAVSVTVEAGRRVAPDGVSANANASGVRVSGDAKTLSRPTDRRAKKKKTYEELCAWIIGQLDQDAKQSVLMAAGVAHGSAAVIAAQGPANFFARLATQGKFSREAIDLSVWSDFPSIQEEITNHLH